MVEIQNTGDMTENADREAGFRRGYAHGAQAVISALEEFLDERVLVKLKIWASNDLRTWQLGRTEEFAAPRIPGLNDQFQTEVKI